LTNINIFDNSLSNFFSIRSCQLENI